MALFAGGTEVAEKLLANWELFQKAAHKPARWNLEKLPKVAEGSS
jgi:hypothetical protein